jgi:excisionase family DNA binding protein
MDRDYITTTEAARLLGISRNRVLALIKAGRLPAEKIGGVWLIKADDLKLVEVRLPGRPRKLSTMVEKVPTHERVNRRKPGRPRKRQV